MLEFAAKTRTLAGWFGSNRTLADAVGRELGKLDWCGVPFCGGCPELPYIDTRAGVAADLHRHIINLARCVREPVLCEQLARQADSLLFHPDELEAAQRYCRQIEQCVAGDLFCAASTQDLGDDEADVDWAAAYFTACWMARGGNAGKRTEFTQGLAVRWNAGGGDSAVRYRSAIESLKEWSRALQRWSFVVLDVFEFLANVKDAEGLGLYCDAPWPDAGEEYCHPFGPMQQARLADQLSQYRKTRVVVRFGEHPLIRRLYPEDRWRWAEQETRNQRNNSVREVLLVNGDPR